jgi:glutaminase
MDAKLTQDKGSSFQIENVLSTAYGQHLENRDGALANYIPELAAVDPNRFGIAIATETGKLYEVGDTDHPFTIQSVSKAFVYCLALELFGRDAVLARVGVEPSGECRRDHGRRHHP